MTFAGNSGTANTATWEKNVLMSYFRTHKIPLHVVHRRMLTDPSIKPRKFSSSHVTFALDSFTSFMFDKTGPEPCSGGRLQ